MRRLLPLLLLALVVVAVPAGAAPVEPAWGPVDAALYPGASLGGYCTFNWVFYTPGTETQAPVAYIGTAGHCTEELGERVETPALGEVGTVVYDSDEVGSDVDFSLIRLDAEVVSQTTPKMRGWDGPTGAITDPEAELVRFDQVDLHGYGLVLGQNDVTRDRFGALIDWTADEYVADMPAVNGDSGSPLLHDDSGLALGIISRYGLLATPPSTDTGPMMPWIFRELAAAGFGTVQLAVI